MFAIVLNVNKNVADWEVSKLTLLDVQQQVGWGVKCCCLRLRLLQRVFRFSGVFCGGILFHFSGLLIEAMSPAHRRVACGLNIRRAFQHDVVGSS